LPNSSPEFALLEPSETVCEPPPTWKRTYMPFPSVFSPSPERPTSA
jgi:hypothetical protein